MPPRPGDSEPADMDKMTDGLRKQLENMCGISPNEKVVFYHKSGWSVACSPALAIIFFGSITGEGNDK